jgi:cytochrome c oxidase subunit 1
MMAMHGVPPGVANPPAPLPPEASEPSAEHRGRFSSPGTMILVVVFLVAFVVYYFVNWNLLSFLWRIG